MNMSLQHLFNQYEVCDWFIEFKALITCKHH
jgi:hypothetical protein